MNPNRTMRVLLVPVAAILTLGACEVEQTREGSLPDVDVAARPGQAPRYEIEQTREAKLPSVDVDVQGGQLPEYEVETPDVEIEAKTVEIPYPDIDVQTPGEDDDEER